MSSAASDVFVSRLDAQGGFVWAKQLGGADDDAGKGVAISPDGCVCLTGCFYGTADFDPGAGTFFLTAAPGGGSDIFVAELTDDGQFVSARAMGGTSPDWSQAIAVAADGSVYTTGLFQGTADFDPGPGTFLFTSRGDVEIFVSKLSPLPLSIGDWVWNDRNRNGLQDDGADSGIAGAVVEIFSSANDVIGDADDVSCAIAITDATGHYRLTGLAGGLQPDLRRAVDRLCREILAQRSAGLGPVPRRDRQ